MLGDHRFLQGFLCNPTPTRVCLGCGVSIEHRRPQSKTCGDVCRKRISKGYGIGEVVEDGVFNYEEHYVGFGRTADDSPKPWHERVWNVW